MVSRELLLHKVAVDPGRTHGSIVTHCQPFDAAFDLLGHLSSPNTMGALSYFLLAYVFKFLVVLIAHFGKMRCFEIIHFHYYEYFLFVFMSVMV